MIIDELKEHLKNKNDEIEHLKAQIKRLKGELRDLSKKQEIGIMHKLGLKKTRKRHHGGK